MFRSGRHTAVATLTNYHWDPVDNCLLMESDQTGATVATYTREPEQFGPLLIPPPTIGLAAEARSRAIA
jgi:hypothetical protein